VKEEVATRFPVFVDPEKIKKLARPVSHTELTDVNPNDHHSRLHPIYSGEEHYGTITDAQHGDKSTIPDAHHAKTGDNEVYGLIQTGALADRPSAGVKDRYYYANDEGVLYRDTGTAWEKVADREHADLDGLDADDHPQYLRTDGTRNVTGLMTFEAGLRTTGGNYIMIYKAGIGTLYMMIDAYNIFPY